ncbi:hypothetical protein H261_13384 [Paramagnetospirillum caucaseum]|uniref:DUF3307 domain-containing protein n=1 Tax=Paramagnetospirillum caucaseum TaxID=1244869 RepID=M3AAD9_9PROT|nr:DUF3307 domain-containing protein [Paramagnetospirillum caucaseum]EME69464.1 hypothetical protein H261_13384 [Paramagnetospirillum caucaseum]
MFSADQFVAHLVGDFVLQSDWMASEKVRSHFAAAVHVVVYTLPFLFISQDPAVLAVIAGTHFIIDRWRLARYVVWVKNLPWRPWAECSATGSHESRPLFLTVWLLIIVDNTMHIICNGLALRYLG